jgi:hypothetical protein
MLLTGLSAFAGNIHLDGIIDLHFGEQASLTTSISEGLIDWTFMTVFIYTAGLLFSRSSIRLIDVAGTQALARWPYLLAVLISATPSATKTAHYLEFKFLKKGEPVEITGPDTFLFALSLLVSLAAALLAILLMYRAYCVACNMKGSKAVASFIVALLLAEIGAKIVLSFLLTS